MRSEEVPRQAPVRDRGGLEGFPTGIHSSFVVDVFGSREQRSHGGCCGVPPTPRGKGYGTRNYPGGWMGNRGVLKKPQFFV